MKQPGCPLCDGPGGVPVFQGPKFRVIRADEAGLPAFYRLVWSEHVSEFSDLAPSERHLCIEAVVQVEQSLRAHLHPTKVNLATLGNVVPHLHWHIIARFEWDSHYPGPVWSPAQREAAPARIALVEQLRTALEEDLVSKLTQGPGSSASP